MQESSLVLIIEDEPTAREALEALLAVEGYQLEFAENGIDGLARAAQLQPDLILLDVMMPGMDGFEVCRRLRRDAVLAEVPVVMITALDDRASRLQGLEAGADDFLSKPFDRLDLRARLRTITRLDRYRKLHQERLNLEKALSDLQMAYDETIEGWSHAVDLRDKETEGHSQRVTLFTGQIAAEFGFSSEALVYARWGALLHDIGKLGVPDSILLKPGPLTPEEWVVMEKHPTYAYEMLNPIEYLRPALDIPYCHHEKWDGSGYPRKLRGEEIPLPARLFAVVDVWDALRSERPYRKGWPKERVLEHLSSLSGIHFDPKAVEAFLSLVERNQLA